MADGDASPQGAPGAPEEPLLSGLTVALREEIMADVEARLSHKADSLWKRGQAELGKLSQDRKEVAASVAELQKRQEGLITEQTAMHSALLDIATKMEFVAMEMREALRAVGKDGAAPNGGLEGMSGLSLELASNLSSLSFLEADGAPPGLGLQGLCTPPRTYQMAPLPNGNAMAPLLPGSPAVLLSLASVLPSAPGASPSNGSPPVGATRLHIADCLDMSGNGPFTPFDAKTSTDYGAAGSSASTSANGSSVGSPNRADGASPLAADTTAASFGCGGTLRADAPAFVPGGCFAT